MAVSFLLEIFIVKNGLDNFCNAALYRKAYY